MYIFPQNKTTNFVCLKNLTVTSPSYPPLQFTDVQSWTWLWNLVVTPSLSAILLYTIQPMEASAFTDTLPCSSISFNRSFVD
jgi:hypothetical protein